MFATSVLDVGVGILLVFLAVSLATSAVTEAIAALLGLRAATLRRGVCDLLRDPDMTGLARDLYASPLANPLTPAARRNAARTPTAIHPNLFALALADTLHARAGTPGAPDTGTPGTAAPAAPLGAVDDPALRRALAQLHREADGDAARFCALVAGWFEAAMRELTVLYRRRIQAISFGVALAIAILADADVLRAAHAIWLHTIVVSGAAASQPIDLSRLTLPLTTPAPSTLAPGGCDALVLSAASDGLFGWTGHEPGFAHPFALLRMVCGWLIVATASLYGASFWFDLLQRFVHLRGDEPDPPPRRAPIPTDPRPAP